MEQSTAGVVRHRIGERVQTVRFSANPLFPLFRFTQFPRSMSAITLKQKEVTEDDQKRRAFMNHSSIHSYNHTVKKDRIIRVTNGRIFRNGKVGLFRFREA